MSFSEEVREILHKNNEFDRSRVKVGDNCVSIGLDDNCLPCICYGNIEKKCEDGTYTYYDREFDIRILFREKDVAECYPDTPKNRTIIKSACEQVIAKWRESVRKQFAK